MFYNFSRGNLRQPSNYLSQNHGSEVGTVPTKLLRSSSAENGNVKEKNNQSNAVREIFGFTKQVDKGVITTVKDLENRNISFPNNSRW